MMLCAWLDAEVPATNANVASPIQADFDMFRILTRPRVGRFGQVAAARKNRSLRVFSTPSPVAQHARANRLTSDAPPYPGPRSRGQGRRAGRQGARAAPVTRSPRGLAVGLHARALARGP